MPEAVRGETWRQELGALVVSSSPDDYQPDTDTVNSLLDSASANPVFEKPEALSYLLIQRPGRRFWNVVYRDTNVVVQLAEIVSGATEDARTPDELDRLTELEVGLIGLGSLGARVALSLARMGVRRFVLVDDDILLGENICRHPLDWTDVGRHKVDAVECAIRNVVAGAEVQVRRVNLTAQENTATIGALASRLGACDAILDLTAAPGVFNLLSHVASSSKRPMLWAEVFAGGIGGLIARSRPGIDPPPQSMRQGFFAFTKKSTHPTFETGSGADYSVEGPDGIVVASDADVAIIAAHLASLAADTLSGKEPSRYPNSMYLIGLRAEWLFEAPMHAIPLEISAPTVNEARVALSDDARAELAGFIRELQSDAENADESSTALQDS